MYVVEKGNEGCRVESSWCHICTVTLGYVAHSCACVLSLFVLTSDYNRRPLGAIVFGEMGDRVLGRKNALVVSIVLITVPSVIMGLLPTYEMWGIAAPILLVLLRMMQGLSVGGQLAGSYVLSIEQSSSKTRGFRGSVCDASSVSRSFSMMGPMFPCTRCVKMKTCISSPSANYRWVASCWHLL